MRALTAAAAVCCTALASLADGGPKIPERMPVDDSPTPWACTMEKLLLGEKCMLEVEPKATREGPAQAQQNIAWAGGAAARACAAAAVPPGERAAEEGVRLACEKEVAQTAIAACGLDGKAALQDEQGRLAVAARECAGRLQEIVARARAQATVGLGCCRCLAFAKCGPPLAQCARELAEHAPGAPLAQCLQRSCSEACAFSRQAQPEEASAPPPPPARPARQKAPEKI